MKDHPSRSSSLDNHLIEQDRLYLIRQRVGNLRQAIGLSAEELRELEELEALIRQDDGQDMPCQNLQAPNKFNQLIAALEAKRVNRSDDTHYDGGEIGEEQSVSSINQQYQELLRESRISFKSIVPLANDGEPICKPQNGQQRPTTLFDFYQALPPKLTLPQFLARSWQISEENIDQKWETLPDARKYELKQNWQRFLNERSGQTPSPFQRVLLRIQQFVTAPIYDGMREISEERYQLETGAQFYFTDKTAVFTIPFGEFADIPRKPPVNKQKPIGFLKAAFVLPEYAHQKKRFFRKGGNLDEFLRYLEHLGMAMNEKQIEFLQRLVQQKALRLYREALTFPDRDEIRGYFLNIRQGVKPYSKEYLLDCLRTRLKENQRLNILHVIPNYNGYPAWMSKAGGGLIVEELYGERISFTTALRVSVDRQLSGFSYHQEPLFMPSMRLANSTLDNGQWQTQFIQEMRGHFARHAKHFRSFAKKIATGKAELHCACHQGNGQQQHRDKCPLPLLQKIFHSIHPMPEAICDEDDSNRPK